MSETRQFIIFMMMLVTIVMLIALVQGELRTQADLAACLKVEAP